MTILYGAAVCLEPLAIPVVGPTYKGVEHDQMPQVSCNMVALELWDHNMPVQVAM